MDENVADFIRPDAAIGRFAARDFARDMAAAFADAQAKRHDADYNLNSNLVAADALALIDRVEEAIAAWQAARSSADRDLKQALFLLMLQKGNLRRED